MSPDQLVRLTTPRDDVIVSEAALPHRSDDDPTESTYRFECHDGPFRSYSRVLAVETETAAGQHGGRFVTERIDYRLDAPYFGGAIGLLIRSDVRRGARGRSPWWAPPGRLDRAAARALGAGCALSIAVGFVGGLITHTMTFIAADLGATLADQTRVLSITRVGALATLTVGLVADRRGRRPLIGVGILGAVAAALATAAATSMTWVAVTQTLSRGLIAGAGVLIAVVVVEEMPVGARAYAVGLLAMSGGLGVGVVLWVLPIADAGPGAWRFIYLLSVLFAVLAVDALRRLPESRRFELATAATTPTSATDGRQARRVGRGPSAGHMSPRRLLLLAIAFILVNVFIAPSQQLQNEYLRSERGFSGARITLFLLLTNTWGGIGIVAGGRFADRIGRRMVAAVGLTGLALANASMFAGGGWPMWAWSIMGSVLGAATVPAIGVLGPELFPTTRRGTANGLVNVAGVTGSIVGLELAGHLIAGIGYGPTFFALASAPLLVIGLLWALPETARVELEDINP